MLTPFTRKLKQTNIFLVGLVFVLVIISAILPLFFKKESTEKIKSIEIGKVKAILEEKTKGWEPPFVYKVSATIKNPNKKFILKEVSYLISAKDGDRNIIEKKNGKIELQSNDSKKMKDSISLDKRGKNISLEILNAKWARSQKKSVK